MPYKSSPVRVTCPTCEKLNEKGNFQLNLNQEEHCRQFYTENILHSEIVKQEFEKVIEEHRECINKEDLTKEDIKET